MNKGTLLKKGKYWSISNTEYNITVPGDFGLTDGMEGKEVEFDNAGGPIKLIRHEGTDYVKKDNGTKDWRGNGAPGTNKKTADQYRAPGHKYREPARAPYNFIPLNREVVPAQPIPDFDKYEIDRLTGYIDLTITNETPFFIRGRRWDDEKRDWVESEDFFGWQNGKPVIPGSSLRGMVRALLEIVSWGDMDKDMTAANQQLYRRSNRNKDGDNISYGFLRKDGQEYKLMEISRTPTQEQKYKTFLKNNPYHYEYVGNDCYYSVGKFPFDSRVWKFVWNSSGIEYTIENDIINAYRFDINRAEDAVDIIKSLSEGFIVNGKKEGKQIGQLRVNIPADKGIPVFFRKADGKVISFGNAKYHRIPYSNSVIKLIRQNKLKGDNIDFAKAIFGQVSDKLEDTKSTRVFFEDCLPDPEQNNFLQFEQNVFVKILSSPKPTTYQHYLKQDSIQVNPGALNTWSHADAEIRGFKNYWHRQTPSIKEHRHSWKENGEVTNSHPKAIKPINQGARFYGRIRFENFSKEELGCLLLVLDLPDGMRHKIGLGKPLGLGSIHLQTVKLFLTDRKERYGKLFNDAANGWNLGEKSDTDLNDYKEAFAKYMGRQLNKGFTTVDDFWKGQDRMIHLKAMLTFDHKIPDWLENTRYMEIEYNPPAQSPYFNAKDGTNKPQNEYKDRPVLPYPEDVIKTGTYKPLL